MSGGLARLERAFARARAEGRAALIGYLTAGDPDEAQSLALAQAAAGAGLDLLELGVPFSDPTADGPTIQAAMGRALRAGASFEAALRIARAVRADHPELGLIAFSYANPLLGPRAPVAVAGELARAGLDGALVVDLPHEVAGPLREPIVEAGLAWIGLVAPTSPRARIEAIARQTSGFVYAIGMTGVTGGALQLDDPRLTAQLAAIRAASPLPVALGFGIRSPAQAAAAARLADGIVVGSALVEAGQAGPDALATAVRGLRAALGTGAAQR